jgi:A/G-specific adenine glycosylase
MNDERVHKFNRALFSWFRHSRRDMAWRETFDPYRILVSEIMLQQTQVNRVREKYDLFLSLFPDVTTLARAPRADVLRAWSGLGYNRRAGYLHECARVVVQKHGGVFPCTYEDLVALPGIGRSTAGALLSFAFGADTPMIDTNIRRILTRVFFADASPRPSDAELYRFAVSIIPKGKGREWNYAMLDVGATRCTARRHDPTCPLQELHGPVDDFVYKKPQSRFAGSRRAYRGKIIRLLIDEGSMTMRAIALRIGLSREETEDIVEDLLSEHLVSRHGARIALFGVSAL